MPALSKKQQKFFGIVRAIQKGEQTPTTPETAKAAADMKKSDVKKFASTKHKGLPEKKVTKEELDKNDKPFVKKLVGKLRKGSKTHAKQADDLEKAMNEEKHGDHEPEMIRSQLKTAARASKRIEKHSKKKENFKAWVQSKITKASDYLDTAADYLDSKDMKEESNPRIPRKPGQPAGSKKHSDLYTDENPKGTIHGLGFKDVATAKASVSKIRNSSRSHAHKIQAAVAMEQRAREMGKTSEAAVYRKFINTMKKKTKKMNEDVKRDEYGDPVGGPKISKKQKAKNLAKNTPDEQHTTTTSEAANPAQQAAIAINMKKKGKKPKDMSEEGLRDWFGKSSGTTKSGRRVRGWVQVGGKYDGKPCARQPGQKTTPKCVSSAKRRSMSKDERDSARRRKVAADPGQPQKTGAAKPTMVSTDPKKKMKENVSFAEAKDKKGKGSGTKDACYHKVKSRYSVWPSAYASGALVKCRKVGAANWGNSTKEEFVKDGISFQQFQEKCWKGYEKKGMKTMFGKRYPNCVKKKTRKEEVEHIDEKINPLLKGILKKTPKGEDPKQGGVPYKITGRMTTADNYQPEGEMTEDKDPCWDTHKQVGMKKKGGKMVPNCVPKNEEYSNWRDELEEGAAWTRKEGKNKSGGLNEKGRKSYERENPGSDLKRPSKKVGNKRRKSFCARMKGMKKKLTSKKTANDPDSRINKSLRAWNC